MTRTPQSIELVHAGIALRLDLYPATDAVEAPAVLVLPGGGFRELTPHDGEGYARWFASIGIHAAVLHYQLVPNPFPLAFQQARAALDALQAGLLIPDVDASRVGVIGSSAGGLLAGLLATQAVLSFEPAIDAIPVPAFHIQSYGLADLALLPPMAVEMLLGDLVGYAAELSPASHVTRSTSPTFVWATAQDGPGFPNALEWARALAAQEVPVELHVYPEGGHGVGLADGRPYGKYGSAELPHTAQWTTACAQWLRWLRII